MDQVLLRCVLTDLLIIPVAARGVLDYGLLTRAEAPHIVPVHHKQLAGEGILQDCLRHKHRPSTEQGGRLEWEVFPRK